MANEGLVALLDDLGAARRLRHLVYKFPMNEVQREEGGLVERQGGETQYFEKAFVFSPILPSFDGLGDNSSAYGAYFPQFTAIYGTEAVNCA